MKLSRLREKLGLKKKDNVSEEDRSHEPLQNEVKSCHQTEGSSAASESSESLSLTEKLKTAFHEKPKEDKELQHRKELDQTIRGFRKSFRHDMRNGVKKISGRIVAKEKEEKDSEKAST